MTALCAPGEGARNQGGLLPGWLVGDLAQLTGILVFFFGLQLFISLVNNTRPFCGEKPPACFGESLKPQPVAVNQNL